MKEEIEIFIDGKKIAETKPFKIECFDKTLFKYSGIIDGHYVFESAFGIIKVLTDGKENISNVLNIGEKYEIQITRENENNE